MSNLGSFKVLIVLFLTMGLFTSSVMAEACFCGDACQNFPNKKASYPFHNHCIGFPCKSCNLEDGQVLKAKNSAPAVPYFKILDISIFSFFLTTYDLNPPWVDGVISWIYPETKVQFTTLYLQNRCLLC